MQVLSLGQNFCIDQKMYIFETIKDLQLFASNLLFNVLHAGSGDGIDTGKIEEPWEGPIPDLRMARLLNDLLDLSGSFEGKADRNEVARVSEEMWGPPIKKFKKRSCNFPPLNRNPNICAFLKQVMRELETILSPHFVNQMLYKNRPWMI